MLDARSSFGQKHVALLCGLHNSHLALQRNMHAGAGFSMSSMESRDMYPDFGQSGLPQGTHQCRSCEMHFGDPLGHGSPILSLRQLAFAVSQSEKYLFPLENLLQHFDIVRK